MGGEKRIQVSQGRASKQITRIFLMPKNTLVVFPQRFMQLHHAASCSNPYFFFFPTQALPT